MKPITAARILKNSSHFASVQAPLATLTTASMNALFIKADSRPRNNSGSSPSRKGFWFGSSRPLPTRKFASCRSAASTMPISQFRHARTFPGKAGRYSLIPLVWWKKMRTCDWLCPTSSSSASRKSSERSIRTSPMGSFAKIRLFAIAINVRVAYCSGSGTSNSNRQLKTARPLFVCTRRCTSVVSSRTEPSFRVKRATRDTFTVVSPPSRLVP
mmetsp:Transcript_24738/g.62202  ORF Transcript_24738/g.62202 Transcript_24738/m.62202 type:complete len:214 (-) Transcript_24738:3830-4471(-)